MLRRPPRLVERMCEDGKLEHKVEAGRFFVFRESIALFGKSR
ncbi:MAG: hypothetical protein OXO51_15890 [Gemmatimonadota bacterium]|nr:hypothetical protein [Gemmatimonadota bacterium]